mgnify:CR=1 FL=1|tara:strand:+ start:257 stop:514 length:258 start_codon:yes stop_codon:yes gene_type:complete
MKYAAIKMNLHKANKEANEGTMMLNMARGLIECSQTADARAELGYDPEAIEYLRSAYNQFNEAAHLAMQTLIDMELARKEAADSE